MRRGVLVLAALAGAMPILSATPVSATPAGPDLAVLAVTPSVPTATPGQRVTVEVVAVNHGPGAGDQAVAITTRGLTADRATCAFGVSSDGPNVCEYGATRVGRRFTTTFVVRVAAPGRGRRAATLTACTTNLTNDPDPVPGNNCRSVAIRLARSR